MNIKFLFLLVPLLEVCVNGADFKCATPQQFQDNYKDKFGQKILEAWKTSDKYLHLFLHKINVFDQKYIMTPIDRIMHLEPETAVKKIEVTSSNSDRIKLEIDFKRSLCGHTGEDYSKMLKCNSRAIISYYGCVEDGNYLYLFEEPTKPKLTVETAIERFSKLDSDITRAVVMLDIIDIFIEFHRENIVYGDISIENLMIPTSEFTNFRIPDIQSANKVGNKYIKAIHLYLPPEYQGKKIKKYNMEFKNDIYSLGLTLARLQGDFESYLKEIKEGLFQYGDYLESSLKLFNEGLKAAFNFPKKNEDYKSIIKKAIELKPEDRYKSMEEFSLAVLSVFKTLSISKNYIEEIEKSETNFDINSDMPSFWRNNVWKQKKGSETNVKKDIERVPAVEISWVYSGSSEVSIFNPGLLI